MLRGILHEVCPFLIAGLEGRGRFLLCCEGLYSEPLQIKMLLEDPIPEIIVAGGRIRARHHSSQSLVYVLCLSWLVAYLL